MTYIHGDDFYICDFCGRRLEISMFSSAPLSDLKREGWEAIFEEVTNIVPSKLIYSQYTGGRWIREHKKTRTVIKIKCDRCIIIGKRVEKIKKIKSKLNG